MTKISHQGFSLVEMAVVLFIISLLIGGLLIPLSAQMDQSRLKATQQDLKNIYQALLGFALINGHLP
ncbi:MAG: prepilin-type N-terminal cleavage/methylation domain-containing protein, partial [Pseudomonadota bacterium]